MDETSSAPAARVEDQHSGPADAGPVAPPVRPARRGHKARTVEAQRIRWGRKTGRRWIRWTVAMKETFLDHLAATCNVKAAAEAIGVDPAGAYYLRRADPAFVTAWGEALVLGYEMLETQLVGHALAGGGREITNGATELTGPIDADLALRLLTLHRADKAPRRGGPKRQVATPEETDAAILKKLAQFARQDAAAERAGGGA